MLTARERQIVRQTLLPFAHAIDRVVVFGSRAMGTARPSSDIDLAIVGRLDERQLARLWTQFDESYLPVRVDLVDYARLGEGPMKRHIDNVGKVLFIGDDLRDNAA